MVLTSHKDGFGSSDSDEDVSKTKQQPKQTDKATDRSGKSKQKSSIRITDVKDTSEKPSEQPGSLINRIDESAAGSKKPERKPHSSPDSRNSMEVKNAVELRIRLLCSCKGHIGQLKETARKFKGFQGIEVEADKEVVKVIGSMESEEFVSYLEKKLRHKFVVLPVKDYGNVVDDHKEDEAGGGPITDCSLGIPTRVQPTCQNSRDNDGVIQPFESTLPGDEQKLKSTVVLQIRQYCQEGCVKETRRIVNSFQGVESVDINVDESLVKVTGTMKKEKLVSFLRNKLKREVVLVPEKRTENATKEYKGLLHSGKNMVALASGGYGKEMEKVPKVVEKEQYRGENVPDGRDTRVPLVTEVSKESKAMSKVRLDNLNEPKSGNADLSHPQHSSQYGSVGNKMHQLKKDFKVSAGEMHNKENVTSGRDVRWQKTSKKSKAVSRVHPVNLDEQTKMNPDLSHNKTRSGINGDIMHHLENSVEGKRQSKVTNRKAFGLCCDNEYLEKTLQTARDFEGVELAKIVPSKGLIVVTGAVDRKKLSLYLKEKLKRDVQVFQIRKNDVTGGRNKVPTNTYGIDHGHVKGDADEVPWPQNLTYDGVRYGGGGCKHTGADEVNYGVDYSHSPWASPFSDEDPHSCVIM